MFDRQIVEISAISAVIGAVTKDSYRFQFISLISSLARLTIYFVL